MKEEDIPLHDSSRSKLLVGTHGVVYKILERKDEDYNRYLKRKGGELKEHEKLSSYFLSALFALSQEANPHRHCLAAHAIRELIEKTLRRNIAEVAMPDGFKPVNIKDLKKEYDLVSPKLNKCNKGSATEAKVEILEKLLEVLGRYLATNKIKILHKKKLAEILFKNSDPSDLKAPDIIINHKTKELIDIYDSYFLGVAHGGHTSDDEFKANFGHFEMHLISMLGESPTAELDKAIDDIESI